jgi:Uma2 family endonuclease
MAVIRQAERPYTAEDLAQMPDDGRRYEILGGELIVSPAPSIKHQWVSMELSAQIRSFARLQQLGLVFFAPLDVRLGRHDIVQPDIVFILNEHLHILQAWGVEGSPDILVQVVSPSSRLNDRIRKSAIYADEGVLEYWIVDLDTRSILTQELVSGEYVPMPMSEGRATSRILTGLFIDPRDIFAYPERLAHLEE